MSTLSPERLYRERVRSSLRRALALVEDLQIADDDKAGLELLELTSEVEQHVYDATYSEVARLRDEQARREQHRAAVAAAKLDDVVKLIGRRADQLAGLVSTRAPSVILRHEVELFLAVVMRLLDRCDRATWRDTFSAPDGSEQPYRCLSNAGEEPHVQELLAWLTERLAPVEAVRP